MKVFVLLICLLLFAFGLKAQHEHHGTPVKKAVPQKKAPVKKTSTKPRPVASPQKAKKAQTVQPMTEQLVDTPDQHMQHKHGAVQVADSGTNTMEHGDHGMQSMSHAFSRSLPMTRNGSGTGWLPDASPMFGYMMHRGAWMYMIHGNVFVRYNKQDLFGKGSRGAEQWDAPNMLMFMGQRYVGRRGLFHFSTMVSLDAAVTGAGGYPLLFQSGETFEGEPLVDRQHPHDLFSELSVSYSHQFRPDLDAFIYLAYPGEPALGPVTFMHRPSGMDNPDAPLSHHWVDATHISFGVATLGLRYRKFKLEGSLFTGREPDENRYNFDKPLMDSRSIRLSYNPNRHWAFQTSHAFIRSPEALHPHNVYRTTASGTFAARTAGGSLFNATFLWGMNKVKGHDGEHAALLEASFRRNRLVTYGRYEWVQKSLEELNLDEKSFGHDAIFPVHALTLGAAYDVLRIKPLRTSIGAQLTVYRPPAALHQLYGETPVAGEVYLRFYPDLMQ